MSGAPHFDLHPEAHRIASDAEAIAEARDLAAEFDGGRLPAPEGNGRRYLKIPLDA